MTILRLSDKQELSDQQYRAEFPNTSFPQIIRNYEDGYAVLFPSPVPAYDPITQGYRKITPQQINGKWYDQYEVYALAEAAVLANQEAAKQRANDSIKQQIAEIERGQARAIREAALTGETSYLAQIELQIVNLRAQLQ